MWLGSTVGVCGELRERRERERERVRGTGSCTSLSGELTLLVGMCHRWGLFVVEETRPAVFMYSRNLLLMLCVCVIY